MIVQFSHQGILKDYQGKLKEPDDESSSFVLITVEVPADVTGLLLIIGSKDQTKRGDSGLYCLIIILKGSFEKRCYLFPLDIIGKKIFADVPLSIWLLTGDIQNFVSVIRS